MENLNLVFLFRIFYRRLLVIVLCFAVAAGAAFAYCEFIATPKYRATASVMVTNGAIISDDESSVKKSVTSTDIQASLNLVDTVADILATPGVYRETAKALGDKYTYNQLMGMASIKRRSETTLFVDVSFQNSDPKEAINIANAFVNTACNYIAGVIPNSNATVAAPAVGAKLTYPRTFATTALVGLAAAAAVYIVFIFAETTNRVIRSEEDFVSQYDVPVLGSIPDFDTADTSGYTLRKKEK